MSNVYPIFLSFPPNRQARLPAILRDRLLSSRPLSCEMRVEFQIEDFSAAAPKWAIYDSPGPGASKFLRFSPPSMHRSPGSEDEVIQNFGTEPSLLEPEVFYRNGRKA
ncbi:hypothetical protein [Aquiflexum lacus]|uniref:hypothetical protein n=1 Tax=Aquiflexum lacus TaxID=2483805 RepID=UPI0018959529|nr:hypothetical protein [Aquiflexum lacus]